MFKINLDKDFAPCGEGNAHDVSRAFPSGVEANFKLSVTNVPKEVLITARISSHADLMRILLATDACRRLGAEDIHLFIPYVPYARQDRVCDQGEAFSLKVFAQILNAQQYKQVMMFDVHSEVAPALINNAVVIRNERFIASVLRDKQNYVIVSPDAGASKKIHHVAHFIGYPDKPVQCSKYRLVGGHIESVDIPCEDFNKRDVYIIDDICDGGATFTKLATLIKARNAGTVNLVVSHGIFSKGLTALKDGGIDHVYTTDAFRFNNDDATFVTEVKLCTIL
jgi:ribose-phosphate pyrophosphokinase